MDENLSASSDKKALWEDLESGPYEQFIQENETKKGTKGKTALPTSGELIARSKSGQPDLRH
eukprot:1204666-Ditylum_brightwellii.AAC.1